ncbi:MAG: DUF2382 domain-containing protein [Janthinobacterium lividum]
MSEKKPPTAFEVEPDQTLRLHDEEIVVTRRRVLGDVVKVNTVTVERERLVEEPLTNERVEILRVKIGREVDAVPEIRHENDVMILPVVEEEITITRRLVLKEEVHLRRVVIRDVHRETIVLRQQEAEITRTPSTSSSGSGVPSTTRNNKD